MKYVNYLNSRPVIYLVIGVILMTLTHMTHSISLLGWICMVPFLLYLHIKKGWRSKLVFLLVLIISWSLITFKIVTPPIPYFIIPLYAIPISLIHFSGYLVWSMSKSGSRTALLFASIMTVFEWVQYTYTPLGSWGSAAYSQVGNTALLQSLSLGGLPLLSFIIYWTNAEIASFTLDPKRRSNLLPPAAVIVSLILFGSLRISFFNSETQETVKVAAVGTESEIGGLPLISFEENQKHIESLIQRTATAAEAGAELIVWNEASFYLLKENESAWRDSISSLSGEIGVTVVASYVVPISLEPFRYENKLVVSTPDGKLLHDYLKHEPVPGEPAVRGTGVISAIDINNVSIGTAICYDYDFPYLARKNKRAGAEIVALPSSDWSGIDPLHTEMAAFRAIENGQSIVRSTRFGLSAAIDPYGQYRAQMSSFDTNDKIMLGEVPITGPATLYSIVGDVFTYLCIVYICILPCVSLINKLRRREMLVNLNISQFFRYYSKLKTKNHE